jgi:hypothetical protein
MVGSIIGLLVMIALTTFMAALMQLSAEVLAPKKILTSSQKAVIWQYRLGLPAAPPPVAEVEAEISKLLCELPRDSSGTYRSGC